MTKSKNFEPIKFAKRSIMGLSMAVGSLGMAASIDQGVAHASGPDMSYLVEQDGTGIINILESDQFNPANAKDSFVNGVNHIRITLASKYGRFVLSETVPSLNVVNEDSIKQIQVEAFFPTKNPSSKPLEAADYTLDFKNGEVSDAYATYVNTDDTELINVNYVPILSKEIYGDPTSGKITADEYDLSKPLDMSTPKTLKTNFTENVSDVNFIGITIGTLILDATGKKVVDGTTVAPVEPLAGNIS